MSIVIGTGKVHTLLNGVTATGAGSGYRVIGKDRTFQANGTTTAGAGSATVKVQVSNNNVDWIDAGTITLTLATTSSSDGFASDAAWAHVRGNVTAISGTGASITLTMAL